MIRIGNGWDIHKLIANRPLVLGSITIPFQKGEAAHSDGDVLIHAIIDALLGALALGDIGTYFPDSDPAFKDVESTLLLRETLKLIAGWSIVNIDCILILESPKISSFILQIREAISHLCDIPIEDVSVKAKTAEGLGPIGSGDAVAAMATVLLRSK